MIFVNDSGGSLAGTLAILCIHGDRMAMAISKSHELVLSLGLCFWEHIISYYYLGPAESACGYSNACYESDVSEIVHIHYIAFWSTVQRQRWEVINISYITSHIKTGINIRGISTLAAQNQTTQEIITASLQR